MVSVHKIFQEKRAVSATAFTLLLFGIAYARHLLISNWRNINRSSTYQTENILWLKQFFIDFNLKYTGSIKIMVNLFFIALIGVLAIAFFTLFKMHSQKKYFIVLHFGLSILAFMAFYLAQTFNFTILDIRSREIIVFLQAPYTFVLIYFTHFISNNYERQNI